MNHVAIAALAAVLCLPGCAIPLGLMANAAGAEPTHFQSSDARKPGVVGVQPRSTP